MRNKEKESILLGHGSGGRLTHELIRDVFLEKLANPVLGILGDSGILPETEGRIAVTTDSFVVSPLFFAGGDIGTLAVNGTVNDLAVSGAIPKYLTLGAIIEEGFPVADLERIVSSIARSAEESGVIVVAGDTKVVERGKGDGLFLSMSGTGIMREGYPPQRPPGSGDSVIVSGSVGDHGAVILAARAHMETASSFGSDCAAVTSLVQALFDEGIVPAFMRDPTRGGLAGVLCDLAQDASAGVEVMEHHVPVKPEVGTICSITGVDPLYLACEGRVVAVVDSSLSDRAVDVWKESGAGAACIGKLTEKERGRVIIRTRYGGARHLMRLTSEILPRIC